jgi:hypothetical protein
MIPINYLAVLVAGIVAMGLGALWYGPLFGKPWMRMAGLTPESIRSMKMNPAVAMTLMFIGCLVMAYVLAHALVFGSTYLNDATVAGGMMGAFWYWLGFVMPVTAGVYLWEGKSWKLWFLNASYYLVALLLMGAILTAFS